MHHIAFKLRFKYKCNYDYFLDNRPATKNKVRFNYVFMESLEYKTSRVDSRDFDACNGIGELKMALFSNGFVEIE